MAGRALKAHVWVDGELYGPDNQPPKAVAAQITNPKAWDDGDVDPDPVLAGPPPKDGEGSGKAKWQAWAKQNGVEVDDKLTREQIISALEGAGVDVEAAPPAS